MDECPVKHCEEMGRLKRYLWVGFIACGIPLFSSGIGVWVVAQTLPGAVKENKEFIRRINGKTSENSNKIWSHDGRLLILENQYKALEKSIDEIKAGQEKNTEKILDALKKSGGKDVHN